MVLREFGPPEVLRLEEVPTPVPGPGDVLIAVRAVSVNRTLDLIVRSGKYPRPINLPHVLGVDPSGIVAAVGEGVRTRKVGDRVTTYLRLDASGGPGGAASLLGLTVWGGYAEYVTVPAGQLLPHPVGLDLQDSAGVPEVACTVWSNLAMTAHLSRGQLLLMHGGASGVGSHAIQVARALGARVAVTAGSAAKLESCRELGAEILINYRDEDFVERVREATDGAGADVIFDIMGASYLDRNLDALAADGRLIIIGMQGGMKGELNIGKLLSKRASVTGTTLRGRPTSGPHSKSEVVAEVTRSVWPMIADGRVRPVIGARLPIQEAAEAHRLLSSGQVTGKIVLTV